MSLKEDAKAKLKVLKKQWLRLEKTPEIFAYRLQIAGKKFLPGGQKFYSELNPQRSTMRRPPQQIRSLNPPFDEKAFNFKKVDPKEVMFKIPYDEKEVAIIINKSPITKYHSLICPSVEDDLPQKLTPMAIGFSVKFLKNLHKKNFHIGYNSPGALASVNHLHLHLIKVSKDLYINNCKLKFLTSDYVYSLSPKEPTKAICFLIHKKDSENIVNSKVNGIYRYITWLIENNYPHNLFITWGRRGNFKNHLKVFVFARKEPTVIKDLEKFNIGFAELAGFVPIGHNHMFNSITDKQVIDKINEDTGEIYKVISKYFESKTFSEIMAKELQEAESKDATTKPVKETKPSKDATTKPAKATKPAKETKPVKETKPSKDSKASKETKPTAAPAAAPAAASKAASQN